MVAPQPSHKAPFLHFLQLSRSRQLTSNSLQLIPPTVLPLLMPFDYNNVLAIGVTSGIGYAMAERFLAEGKVVGRRKNRLHEFVEKYSETYGKDKVASYVFNITKLDEMAEWTALIQYFGVKTPSLSPHVVPHKLVGTGNALRG